MYYAAGYSFIQKKKKITVHILKNVKHAQVSRRMHSGISPAVSIILEKEHHPQTLQAMV